MRIQYFQHVPFEGPAGIEAWALSRGHAVRATRLYAGEPVPDLADIDWLVVLGGPMNIHEEDRYPFLAGEKGFIEEAIGAGKRVLGVCLGAQLVANVLGAEVSKSAYEEIGWFPVRLTDEAVASSAFSSLPKQFTTFHWHGDQFQIPSGAIRVFSSDGCGNQAFAYGERVVGLQFHPEATAESVGEMLRHEGGEIRGGRYVQAADEILSAMNRHLKEGAGVMAAILDGMAGGRSPATQG